MFEASPEKYRVKGRDLGNDAVYRKVKKIFEDVQIWKKVFFIGLFCIYLFIICSAWGKKMFQASLDDY